MRRTIMLGPDLGPTTPVNAAVVGIVLVIAGMLGGIDPSPGLNPVMNTLSIGSIILGLLMLPISVLWAIQRGRARRAATQGRGDEGLRAMLERL